MSVLVLGDGAEDARHVLGRAVLDAGARFKALAGLDWGAAARSLTGGTPDDLVRWSLTSLGVSGVVVVGLGSADLSVLNDAAATVVHVGLEAALWALDNWCVENGLTDAKAPVPPGPAAAACLQLLRAAEAGHERAVVTSAAAPRVSALITLHDNAAHADAAMSSLLEQDYDDFEIIVLDDGSSDDTLAVLRRYEHDPRVSVLAHANIGRTGRMDMACNLLVRRARGELIAWLGGDDIARPERLRAQVQAFDDDPGLALCHTAAQAIEADGSPVGPVWQLERGYDELSCARDMLVGNLIGSPGLMITREAFHNVGLYEDGLVCDYQLALKASRGLRLRYLPRLLTQYRVHATSLTGRTGSRSVVEREAYRIRRSAWTSTPLEVLYPELVMASAPQLRPLALLDLGVRLMSTDPELAADTFAAAAEEGAGEDALHNRVVALLAAQDREAALVVAREHSQRSPSCAAIADALTAGVPGRVTLRPAPPELQTILGRIRAEGRTGARRWDGTDVGCRRAYVGLGANSAAVAAASAAWARATRAQDRLRWVVPTLGAPAGDVLEHLLAVPGGTSLAGAADVVIEDVDLLGLLPPEEDRPTGVLTRIPDATSLAAWAAAA